MVEFPRTLLQVTGELRMHEGIRTLSDADFDAIHTTWISIILFAKQNDARAKYAEQAMLALLEAIQDGGEHFLLFGRVDAQSSIARLLTSGVDETPTVVVFRLGRTCESFATQAEIEEGLALQRFTEIYEVE